MYYIDNLKLLKEKYPFVYEDMKGLEGSGNSAVQVLAANQGPKTMTYNANYIHSKYDPLREAEMVIDQYKEIDEYEYVLFYGIGLGYHIEKFAERHPGKSLILYEPIPDIFQAYLENRRLRDLPLKSTEGIFVEAAAGAEKSFIRELVNLKGRILIVELPSYKRIFPDKLKAFLTDFQQMVRDKRGNMFTNYAFQQRWIVNSLKNFPTVLKTPNLMLHEKERFAQKPAVIVAAGPALNEEFENLRKIKAEGSAYVFAVGSAVNALLNQGIEPDAFCSYDPSEANQKVFQRIIDEQIKTIPLIFGSTLGYEVLAKYPGPKYHMIVNQDVTALQYLKPLSEETMPIIHDAPSIANITFELLAKLGFSPIILVGQNLSYQGNKIYAQGINYGAYAETDEIIKGLTPTEDVYGGTVYTNEGFKKMKQQLESYIQQFSYVQVYNTTKGGVKIDGAEFVELSQLIQNVLVERVYSPDWLPHTQEYYDRTHLLNQAKLMRDSHDELAGLMENVDEVLKNIKHSAKVTNAAQMEKMFLQFDQAFADVKQNTFFRTYILPTIRVQNEIFLKEIQKIREEKVILVKTQKFIQEFSQFLGFIKLMIQQIEPIYLEMDEALKAD